MKLLPYIIPFVKDAAKAVKRIRREEFKEVVDETLTELLGIATLVVKMYAIRREGEQEVLHLWCAHRAEVAVCTRCGALSTTIHQEEARCIRHLDVWGKKTFLHFPARRFQCEQCGRPFCLGPQSQVHRQQILGQVRYHPQKLVGGNPQFLHRTGYQRLRRGSQRSLENDNARRFRVQELRQLQTPDIRPIRCSSR